MGRDGYYRHSSGEIYALHVTDTGRITRVSGPHQWRDIVTRPADAYYPEYQDEDVEWANEEDSAGRWTPVSEAQMAHYTASLLDEVLH